MAKEDHMYPFILSLVLIVLAVSPVFADGGCPERAATQQERTAFQSTYSAAKAAVPTAPKDWVVTDETAGKTGESVPDCPGSPSGRPVCYWFKFKFAYSAEASNRALQNAVANAMKGTQQQEARLAELDSQIRELEEAKKAAGKRGDRDEKNRIREQLKVAEREQGKLKMEASDAYMQRLMSGQVAADVDGAKPARQDAELIIKVNEERAWIPARNTPIQMPGASQAYWCKGENGGRLVILLGQWDAKFKLKLAETSVVTRPQNMIVEISGEQQMAESLARRINLDLLKKQL